MVRKCFKCNCYINVLNGGYKKQDTKGHEKVNAFQSSHKVFL